MRRIFGAPKKDAPVATIDETTDKLVSRGDRVDEQIKKLDEQLMKYKEQIKKTRPGPAQDAIKRRALQVLKQKKLYEGQRDQLYQQQFNMEQTRFTVDSIKDTITTVQALSIANKEMKSTMKKNKELDLNYIDKLQDDMFDMMVGANRAWLAW
ncbi:Snf7 family [Haematococcus lacustris]